MTCFCQWWDQIYSISGWVRVHDHTVLENCAHPELAMISFLTIKRLKDFHESSPFIGCMIVTLFGYFVTLDWMTHHPELHSSIHPRLVPIQKHNNVYTKILLIIIAEWMLCMLFPFGRSSLTLTILMHYHEMNVSRSSHCTRQNCISLVSHLGKPKYVPWLLTWM